VGHGESCFSPFRDGVSSVKYRCMVCATRSIGSGIILDAPMVLLGDEALAKACFDSFGGSANLDAK
jgi:hypothetical protein